MLKCQQQTLHGRKYTESNNAHEKMVRDFPGGAVVKNPPASAEDTGSSSGPGRSHMPWSH